MVRLNPRQSKLPSISARLKEIDATRADIYHQLMALDTARAHLLHQLAALDIESPALHREFRSIMNDNAAISVLPNELLAAIFEFGHGSQAPEDHFETVVSSVTQHWRGVALKTPRLWSVILYGESRRQLEPVALYLSRSKAVLIDLRIKIVEINDGSISQKDIGNLFQLLSSHFGRCHRLSFFSFQPTRVLGKLLHCLRSVSAPLLRQIEIFCDIPAFGDDYLRVLPARGHIFNGGAPLLTSVSLKNVGLPCCLPPLGSVTAMYLHGEFHRSRRITSRDWMMLISSAPSLIHLEVHGDFVAEDWAPSMAFEIPLLQTLSVSAYGNDESSYRGFMGCLRGPRLEVLVLNYFSPAEINDIRPNPFPSLHTLVLQDIYTKYEYDRATPNILAAFPYIRHLVWNIKGDDDCTPHFIGAIVHDRLVSLLKPDHDPGLTFMPHLRTIALPSPRNRISWVNVRALLVARESTGQPLRKLFVGANRLAEVSAVFSQAECIVRVEEWKPELVPGWPAWSSLP